MNTVEPRWRVVVPIADEEEWELMLAEVSDRVEGVVELADSAELYFVRREEAQACAIEFGLEPPIASQPGGGEVFGQFSHPTTELCLQLMPGVIRPGDCVADIGSGTGALSAKAIELGAAIVVAADIDWPAAQATKRALPPAGFAVLGSASALASRRFDVVLANLHLGAWRGVASEIARIAAGNSHLIASGFLPDQEREVGELLAAGNWSVATRVTRDGWLGLAAGRST